jgi:hypothetical protein
VGVGGLIIRFANLKSKTRTSTVLAKLAYCCCAKFL